MCDYTQMQYFVVIFCVFVHIIYFAVLQRINNCSIHVDVWKMNCIIPIICDDTIKFIYSKKSPILCLKTVNANVINDIVSQSYFILIR